MRAREFTINVPITIKINGDDDPQIDMPSNNDDNDDATFVSPLQQELELKKAQIGKTSDVIDDITDNDDDEKINESADELYRILELIRK